MTALPSFARFWMVCRKPTHRGSKTEPRARYSHKDDAVRAAGQLAREHDHPFVVLEAVEIIHPGTTEQESLL